MTSSSYLLAGLLLLLGIGLLICELRIPRMRTISGGLGINIFAAGVVLLIQALHEEKLNVTPYIVGGTASIVLMLPIVAIRQRRAMRDLSEALARAERLTEERDAAKNASQTRDERPREGLTGAGLTLYARNYEHHFREVTGKDFGDFVRSFVLTSPPGTEFKIVGIDWTELFGAAVSATSERYLRLLNEKRTMFKVVLLDPRSRVALEKRLAEYDLEVDGKKRYHESHPDRVYGKILGSVSMIAEYHKVHPQQVQLKFIPDLPVVCAVMNGSEAIFYLYSRCHKGWDSPVFRANRVENGVYEFLDQYFNYLWEHPGPAVSDQVWEEYRPKLTAFAEQLEQVIRASCQGPPHANCAKLFE